MTNSPILGSSGMAKWLTSHLLAGVISGLDPKHSFAPGTPLYAPKASGNNPSLHATSLLRIADAQPVGVLSTFEALKKLINEVQKVKATPSIFKNGDEKRRDLIGIQEGFYVNSRSRILDEHACFMLHRCKIYLTLDPKHGWKISYRSELYFHPAFHEALESTGVLNYVYTVYGPKAVTIYSINLSWGTKFNFRVLERVRYYYLCKNSSETRMFAIHPPSLSLLEMEIFKLQSDIPPLEDGFI
ncbi:hypothetical protein DSO57_1035322 [Entomophthora muscae]|uniref:Uncharacterized protein n=1 Tax=Entomophthora muscae TaxID=34485 RepID=A0ACC2SZP8_9FUNG|nr:hypothetical protein DSO57_1035322 [Entomophthora muscae]